MLDKVNLLLAQDVQRIMKYFMKKSSFPKEFLNSLREMKQSEKK